MVANVNFNITHLSDPGHGYLIVTSQQMQMLGLNEDNFSSFSYKNNERSPTQYALEEDCDAEVFFQTANELGIKLNVSEEYVDQGHAVQGWPKIHDIPF